MSSIDWIANQRYFHFSYQEYRCCCDAQSKMLCWFSIKSILQEKKWEKQRIDSILLSLFKCISSLYPWLMTTTTTMTTETKSSTIPRVTIVQRSDRYQSMGLDAQKRHAQSPFPSPKKIHPSSETNAGNHEKSTKKQSYHISIVPRHPPPLLRPKDNNNQNAKLSSKASEASLASQSQIDLTSKQPETNVSLSRFLYP